VIEEHGQRLAHLGELLCPGSETFRLVEELATVGTLSGTPGSYASFNLSAFLGFSGEA
jgi:hypothetical protein